MNANRKLFSESIMAEFMQLVYNLYMLVWERNYDLLQWLQLICPNFQLAIQTARTFNQRRTYDSKLFNRKPSYFWTEIFAKPENNSCILGKSNESTFDKYQ